MKPLIFCLAAALMLLGGCGYHVGPIKPTPMRTVKRIAVPNWKNETLEPRIETLMANLVIKQLQQDGTYQITTEDNADAVLHGRILQIERRPVRSLRGNILQTREYQLTLRCRYKIVDKAGRVLDERNANGTTSFFVTGDSLISADSNQDERQALPLAAEEVATRLTSQVAEGW